ncbi:MAG: serine/threonine protein kinase [Clostridia bacterium]|nr:serine/threonine protein kinase [Clostridia bacterium]
MLEIGSLVDGKYKILSEIGHGGMSVVYMAINEKANKTWAIKEVRRDGIVNFEAVKQGLTVETDMMKRLNHPNLPSIVDVIEGDDTFLIVMDYIEGISLKKKLDEEGAQSQENVIEWAKQLCDVLGYLHTRTPAIIYRDMKPANVMLKPDGKPMLIDFGTAREFKERNVEDTTCLGTRGYAAPEQFGGMGQTDARTDIYCLGATMYHLVTGYNPSEPPYEMLPIRSIDPSLSSGLEKIILKCTQQNPNERYQSASELMYDLEHYEEIDDKYRKKQVTRVAVFVASLVLAVCFFFGGLTCRLLSTMMASDNYNYLYDAAVRNTDPEMKRELFLQCIDVPGKNGDISAYLGLVKLYINDSSFSVEESTEIISLVTNNKEALIENPEDYATLCFEIGCAYWFYYEYGDEAGTDRFQIRSVSAVQWFLDVMTYTQEDSADRRMAEAYYNIGLYNQEIHQMDLSGRVDGQYLLFFNNMSILLDEIGMKDSENPVVRLEIFECFRSVIQANATGFKLDGITEAQLNEVCDKIYESLPRFNKNQPVVCDKVTNIEKYELETKEAITLAYST